MGLVYFLQNDYYSNWSKYHMKIYLFLVVKENEPARNESFDSQRMTQQKTPDSIFNFEKFFWKTVKRFKLIAWSGSFGCRKSFEFYFEGRDALLVLALLLLRIFFWEGSLHHVLHSKLFNSKLKHRFTYLSYKVVKGLFLVFTCLLKLLF